MKLKKYQKISVAVVLTTILVVGFFAVQKNIYDQDNNIDLVRIILFTGLVSASITLVNLPIFKKIKLEYPIRIDIFKRLIIVFLISSITASLIITIWVFVFRFIGFPIDSYAVEYGVLAVVFDNIVVAVIVNFVIGAVLNLRDSIIGWKKSVVEAEQYKRKSIESQYSALVNQINPHFLFNSMNALASLIPQSPEKAVEFVTKFSKVYRYVLDVKDTIVTELKDEIDFLESYCYLQKIRFGRNLLIEKYIDTDRLNYFLPPLSIQLLVENAIKHNEISKSNPLKVIIESDGQFICVKNNLRLKHSKQDSPGIGLTNLRERYGHLCDEKPEFYIKNNEYIARIPLIKEE